MVRPSIFQAGNHWQN